MFSPRTILSPILNAKKDLLRTQAVNKASLLARACSSQKGQEEDYSDVFKHYSDAGPLSTVDDTPLSERDYDRFISKRSALREPAITRQITSLAYTVGKEFLSLAEGMPSEEVFPFERLIMDLKDGGQLKLDGEDLNVALQYVPTQGMPALLCALRELQHALHRPPQWQQRDVLLVSGGQFGLYSAADMLLEPGDPVLLPRYTYTGFHSVLRPYEPEIIGIPEDDLGVIPEVLDMMLTERRAKGQRMPRLMYVVPTGSNPSGTVLPECRRRTLYELACRHDFLLLEDDPYMMLNYTGNTVPSLLSLDVQGRVVRVDSLSKVVAPGLRAGWVTAPVPLLRRLELQLQADHLHSCTLSQAVLSALLSQWGRAGLARQVRRARNLYQSRRDALHEALLAHDVPATWRRPDAGMFLWLKVDVPDVHHMVFKKAFERGLMVVPGQASLFASGSASTRIRLAFSKVPLEDMPRAAALLADVLRRADTTRTKHRHVRATSAQP